MADEQDTIFRRLEARALRKEQGPAAGGNSVGAVLWTVALVLGLQVLQRKLHAAGGSFFDLSGWGRAAHAGADIEFNYAVARVIVGGAAAWLLYGRKTAVPNAVRAALIFAYWLVLFEPGARHTNFWLFVSSMAAVSCVSFALQIRRDADWFTWRKGESPA